MNLHFPNSSSIDRIVIPPTPTNRPPVQIYFKNNPDKPYNYNCTVEGKGRIHGAYLHGESIGKLFHKLKGTHLTEIK